MLEIKELIRQENNPRGKEILKELLILNKRAYKWMTSINGYGKPYSKERYRRLWKTDIWAKAKELLKEYFELHGQNGICPICNKKLDKSIMHHDMYNYTNYFTPLYVMFIHPKCHDKLHKGD